MSDSSRKIALPLIALAIILAGPAAAQQPNSPMATMLWDGQNGAPFPITVNVNTGAIAQLSLQLQGAPNQPYLVTNAPAGINLGQPLGGFGILDQDISQGIQVILNGTGIAFAPPSPLDILSNTGPSGTSNWSIPISGVNATIPAIQALVGDPTSVVGFTLTALSTVTSVLIIRINEKPPF